MRAIAIRRRLAGKEETFSIRRPGRRRRGRPNQHILFVRFLRSGRTHEQTRQPVILSLIGQIRQPLSVRRPDRMGVHVALRAQRIPFYWIRPDRVRHLSIALLHRALPLPVQFFPGHTQHAPHPRRKIERKRLRACPHKPLQRVRPIFLRDIAHQRKPVIVHHLVAQTGLGKHPHFI